MKTQIPKKDWQKINLALASAVIMGEDLIKINNKDFDKPLREMYSSWLENIESARRILRENLKYE